ncbi:DUF4179 domain-containing protein [Lysinibacillus cavernae]|uniref:DUF4179 domain-containing protein n=1 Tax=Lysinibacillus cavernae TaxID=2666135 RepID=UPI001E5700AC|nr:DUF4179 domain-containing protein [Lysinibacillus cavernae]
MLSGDMLRVVDLNKEKRGRNKWGIFVFLLLMVGSGLVVLYLWWDKDVDFEAYKTEVGKTANNSLGRLTLNEVIIDDNQILLKATFEPVKEFTPDHQVFFFPQILVNGKDYMVRNGGQSIAQSANVYTIYNSIKMDDFPTDKNVALDIRYKDWNVETPIDKPWEFQLEASQEQLQEDREVFTVDKKMKHVDQQEIMIDKVVSTPISTTIYFHSEQRIVNDALHFKIQSKSGKLWSFETPYPLNKEGTKWGSRVDALYLTERNYKLIPVNRDGRKLGAAITMKKD